MTPLTRAKSGDPRATRSKVAVITIESIVAMAALMWPALYNGQPFFHYDTVVYVRGADAGLQKLTGLSRRWKATHIEPTADAQTPREEFVTAPGRGSVDDKIVLSGRSVYYGALLYLGDRLGDFWFTVLIQAALLMLAMGLFLKAFGVPVWPQLPVAAVLMGVLTSASFYVSFLMPDLFAAIALLACASLIGANSLRRVDYCLWGALLAFSLVSHVSLVLIAVSLLSFGLLVNLLRRSWVNWCGLAVIAGCLVFAGAAEEAFRIAVTRLDGTSPLRPPFLMARAIEDGPGYQYLRDTCPGNGFKICEFLPRLPMSSEDFLWSWNTPGLYAPASAEVRRELSAEQYRFYAAVLRHDPIGIASTSIQDGLRQFARMGLTEFDTLYPRAGFASKLPLEYRATFSSSGAYRGAMPTRAASGIQQATFGVCAATLLAVLAWPRLRRKLDRSQLFLLAMVAIGIMVNAAICGALSSPLDRYEARVAWLVPFIAVTVILAVWQRRRQVYSQ